MSPREPIRPKCVADFETDCTVGDRESGGGGSGLAPPEHDKEDDDDGPRVGAPPFGDQPSPTPDPRSGPATDLNAPPSVAESNCRKKAADARDKCLAAIPPACAWKPQLRSCCRAKALLVQVDATEVERACRTARDRVQCNEDLVEKAIEHNANTCQRDADEGGPSWIECGPRPTPTDCSSNVDCCTRDSIRQQPRISLAESRCHEKHTREAANCRGL